MTNVTTELIKQLREKTGAGIMDAKKALQDGEGDVEKAIDILRKQGQLKAMKKSDRQTREGVVESYIHMNNRVGSLVELNCETDFVARNEEFKGLAHDIAMQVAAMSPLYVSPEDVPSEVIEREKEIYREQMKGEKKPAQVMEKIIEGKLQKFFSEACLLKQAFFKDEEKTIEDLITEKVTALGENIQVKDFKRLSL